MPPGLWAHGVLALSAAAITVSVLMMPDIIETAGASATDPLRVVQARSGLGFMAAGPVSIVKHVRLPVFLEKAPASAASRLYQLNRQPDRESCSASTHQSQLGQDGRSKVTPPARSNAGHGQACDQI